MAGIPLEWTNMFRDPPARKGSGIASLPDYAGGTVYESPDGGRQINESYRMLFPGSDESKLARKVGGYRKCQWAYTANHSYSGCVDLIAKSIMTNGESPGTKAWRLSPIVDEDGKPMNGPDPAQKEAFYQFTRNCHPNKSFDALISRLIHDVTKADSAFMEVSLTQIKNPIGVGQPGGLWALAQEQMRCQVDDHGELVQTKPFVQLRDKKDPIFYTWPQILLLTNDGAGGTGYLPQTPADKIEIPIHTSIEAELFVRSYFTSGAKLGMVFENSTWNKPQADAFLKFIQDDWTDSRKGHKPYMLYGGTTLHEAPSTVQEFAQFLAIQQYDVRKICSIFGIDSRIISSPGEGNLGGKGEREQIWLEFILRTVNPRKAAVGQQITHQILLQGFGITDWQFELVQFAGDLDEASRLAAANAYSAMVTDGIVNLQRLADLNTIRAGLNRKLTPITVEELSTMPARVLRGTPDQALADPAQVDSEGQPVKVQPVAKVPTAPAPAPGGATGTRVKKPAAPRTATQKRTPFKVINSHKDAWIKSTTEAMVEPLKAAIAKSRAKLMAVYDLADIGKSAKAMQTIKNDSLMPGGGTIRAKFQAAHKAYYRESFDLCTKEIHDLAARVKGKRETVSEATVGGVDDFIESWVDNQFSDLYASIITMERSTFLQGLRSGWSVEETVGKMETAAVGYMESEITQVVRTANADFFNQARLKAGAESGIVPAYEFSPIDDDRECDVCEAGAGLQVAAYRDEIRRGCGPLHPNCRCMWSPIIEGEDWKTDEGQLADFISGINPDFGGH